MATRVPQDAVFKAEYKVDGGLRQWLLSARHDGLFAMTQAHT